MVYYDPDLTIAPWRLRFNSTSAALGKGTFGEVFKGTWTHGRAKKHTEPVAIKVLTDRSDGSAMAEVKRMSRLDHPNIVGCLGISFPGDEDAIWIVMEPLNGIDLSSFIADSQRGLVWAVMVRIAQEVAEGMRYIHYEAYQRHQDLSARNILIVGPNDTAKIGDFGRFDSNYEDDYFMYFDWTREKSFPCPLRWMAPENLPNWSVPYPLHTRKGDVWQFGVLLFEIWSKGAFPFDGLEEQEVGLALRRGDTPKTYRKVLAKASILLLMDDCWKFIPDERPNFKKILNALNNLEK